MTHRDKFHTHPHKFTAKKATANPLPKLCLRLTSLSYHAPSSLLQRSTHSSQGAGCEPLINFLVLSHIQFVVSAWLTTPAHSVLSPTGKGIHLYSFGNPCPIWKQNNVPLKIVLTAQMAAKSWLPACSSSLGHRGSGRCWHSRRQRRRRRRSTPGVVRGQHCTWCCNLGKTLLR